MPGQFRLHEGGVKVPHQDHRHIVGAVPGRIEIFQPLCRGVLNNLRQAYGQPLCIGGSSQEDGDDLPLEPFPRPQPGPVFFHYDGPLAVHRIAFKAHPMGPVVDNRQGLGGNPLQAVRPGFHGHVNAIDGKVKGGKGVGVGAETHPQGSQIIQEFRFGKPFGPVEAHVFHKVGQPLLVVLFQNRARVDRQGQVGPVFRAGIFQDIVPQPVGQGPGPGLGHKGYRIGALPQPAVKVLPGGEPGAAGQHAGQDGADRKDRDEAPRPPETLHRYFFF